MDIAEPVALFELLRRLDVRFVNVTLGSPYYTPHLIRPALYPPSDGYLPPEDPLVGVMRHLEVVRRLKEAFPDFCLVGSGYTYLQEYLPNVAQAVVRRGWTDLVGLGRMVLAYPELPLDILSGRGMQKKRSAAPSAIAPQRLATAWSRAAIRSTRTTRSRRNSRSSLSSRRQPCERPERLLGEISMHIGLIGGIGPAATEFYYRGLIDRHAHSNTALELTIVHADVREMARNLANRDARKQAGIFRPLVERLAAAGAMLLPSHPWAATSASASSNRCRRCRCSTHSPRSMRQSRAESSRRSALSARAWSWRHDCMAPSPRLPS